MSPRIGTGPGSTPCEAAAMWRLTRSPTSTRSNSRASKLSSPLASTEYTPPTISSQISATSSKRRATCGCSKPWRSSTI